MRAFFGAFLTDPIHINEAIIGLWLEALNVTDALPSLYKDHILPLPQTTLTKTYFITILSITIAYMLSSNTI